MTDFSCFSSEMFTGILLQAVVALDLGYWNQQYGQWTRVRDERKVFFNSEGSNEAAEFLY